MKQNLPDKAFVAFVCLVGKPPITRPCAHHGGNRARLGRTLDQRLRITPSGEAATKVT